MPEPKTIGELLTEGGHMKQWLAVKMGISPSYLSKLMKEERPWTEELKAKAAAAFGRTPEQVVFLTAT